MKNDFIVFRFLIHYAEQIERLMCYNTKVRNSENESMTAFLRWISQCEVWYRFCLTSLETRRFVTANAHLKSWLTSSMFLVFVSTFTVVEKQRPQRYVVANGIRSWRALPERIGYCKRSFRQKVTRSSKFAFNMLSSRRPSSSAFALTSLSSVYFFSTVVVSQFVHSCHPALHLESVRWWFLLSIVSIISSANAHLCVVSRRVVSTNYVIHHIFVLFQRELSVLTTGYITSINLTSVKLELGKGSKQTLCWAVRIFTVFPCSERFSWCISAKGFTRYILFKKECMVHYLPKQFLFFLFQRTLIFLSILSCKTRFKTFTCDNQRISVRSRSELNYSPSSSHNALNILEFVTLPRIWLTTLTAAQTLRWYLVDVPSQPKRIYEAHSGRMWHEGQPALCGPYTQDEFP